MSGRGWLVAVALAAVLVGALLLKGFAARGPADPRASVDNGAPRGLLALYLWLEERGVSTFVVRSFGEALPEGRSLYVVPPAEASSWNEREVARVMDRVGSGDVDLLVMCDEDAARARRLSAWWRALDVACAPAIDGVLPRTEKRARGTLPAYGGTLFVRGAGRALTVEGAPAIPAWVDEGLAAVVLRRPTGSGMITVLSSASVLANDGLAHDDNAAFFRSLVPAGGRVVFDEAHHLLRGADVVERAFSTVGPRIAGLALLLLVPFVLFGFAPRRGDPPPVREEAEAAAARAEARALAALYRSARVSPRAGLDREPSARGRSAP